MTKDRNDHDAVDAMDDDQRAEVAEIRAEIEETRVEMGGTLNELGDRLEPSHLVEQAKENVREATIGRVEETAKGVSDMVLETIKKNPVPAAMAAAGLALLWANRSQNGHGRSEWSRAGYGYESRPASMYATSERGGIGATARDAASTVTDAVGSAAEGAQQATGEVIDRAGETAQEVSWRLERFMQANPLAVGAIAAGAGALIGSLVPETTKEREVLGEASRQVGTLVRDTVDEAATKADETLDQADEKVSAPA
jgi:ElaB/YqjD/DUF883 family membrane-anchored ribosome-binding protein